MRLRMIRLPLLAVAALALAACGDRADHARDGAARMDTLNQDPMDGLSAEELQRQALPMSPEEAEARGMVDTTIHVEPFEVVDTLPIPPGAVPQTPTDTVNVPDAAPAPESPAGAPPG